VIQFEGVATLSGTIIITPTIAKEIDHHLSPEDSRMRRAEKTASSNNEESLDLPQLAILSLLLPDNNIHITEHSKDNNTCNNSTLNVKNE
jgi:hypothetical protein